MKMNTTRWRLRSSAIAFFACTLVSGTSLFAQDYPLAAGTRWTYHLRKEVGPGAHFVAADAPVAKGNVLETTLIVHVAGTEQIDGKTYNRIESQRGSKLFNVDWLALTPEGLMHAKSVDYTEVSEGSETELNPPARLLSPTLAPQENWNWQDSQSLQSSRTTVLGREEARVPAGTYRTIPVRTQITIPTEGQPLDVTVTQWFVPGIGNVQREVRMEIAGHLLMHNTETLEKFERAPKR